jgi:sodium/proline symporter
VVALALLATGLAMNPDSKVLDVVSYAWAGLGASLGPAILLSLYWRGMTAQGALAGVLTGGCSVIVWSRLEGGLFDLYALLPGFVLALIAIVVVSLLSCKGLDSRVAEQFDRMLAQR